METKIEETGLVTQESTAITIEKPVGALAILAAKERAEYAAVNAGVDTTGDRLEEFIKVGELGEFEISGDSENPLGRTIEVVIFESDNRNVVWGLEGSEFENKLLVNESTLEAAEKKLYELLETYPSLQGDYTDENIKQRTLITFATLSSLKDGGTPEIFFHDASITTVNTFRKYRQKLFKGRFPKVTPKVGVKDVVTLMKVAAFTSGSNKYKAVDFEPVKMFDIKEYSKK
jgi:hypothetical protein